MTLSQTIRTEALEEDCRLQPAAGQQARNDLLLEHPLQLARHAGREEEARAADVEREATGGADRIVDDLRGRGQHGLLLVVGRHHAAAPAEEPLHAGQPLLVHRQLDTGGLAAISCERSSTVGPRPPLTMTASARSEASWNASSRLSRSSPTVVSQATERPTS